MFSTGGSSWRARRQWHERFRRISVLRTGPIRCRFLGRLSGRLSKAGRCLAPETRSSFISVRRASRSATRFSRCLLFCSTNRRRTRSAGRRPRKCASLEGNRVVTDRTHKLLTTCCSYAFCILWTDIGHLHETTSYRPGSCGISGTNALNGGRRSRCGNALENQIVCIL